MEHSQLLTQGEGKFVHMSLLLTILQIFTLMQNERNQKIREDAGEILRTVIYMSGTINTVM
jgi:hypothetical protein